MGLLLPWAALAAGQERFATSFEGGEPQPVAQAAGWQLQVGGGPRAPYAAKAGMGYSGQHALRYRVEGEGGRRPLFALDLPVEADTALSWMVLPELVDDDPEASTGTSLDLVFDDGQRLSSLDVRDQHGVRLGAAAQAASKTLYPQQWARKQVRLGDIPALQGRRIRAIELEVLPARNVAAGWIDDIAIGAAPAAVVRRPSEHVITTRGTQSNGVFSRGNNIPATAMPHGFNFWVPVTDAGTLGWLYRWSEHNGPDNRPRLQALSISHQPSPWMGDRQTFQMLPLLARDVPEADREARALSFSHDQELARPHHYRVDFDNGIRAEIAPTERAAILRFRFPSAAEASVLFDNVDERGGLQLDAQAEVVSGYTDTRSGLSNGATRMFVYARFDRPWRGSGRIDTGRPTGYVQPGTDADGVVHLRIATSLISVEQARRNLELEIGERGFEAVAAQAQDAWDALLGRVQLTGASEDQLRSVYSNLYRLFLYPNIAHENTGSAGAPQWQHADQSSWAKDAPGGDALRTSARVLPGKVYVNNGFWDTFRTTWPAYALFAPTRAGEMVDGFLQQYRDGGWVARWSSPGYADLMVGTSSDVAFADAWRKGVGGFDPHEAYAAALRNATVVPPVANVGRKGLAQSMYRGYADTGVHEGLSWTLEGALNDFGLAQMADRLAAEDTDPARARRYREEADYFRARAAGYVHLFDPSTGFFRGRDAQGQWREPAADFDPRVWGHDYTEANAWTFAFTAVHDGAGLASLFGGSAGLGRKLDALFSKPETASAEFAGSYGRVIHEMTEARDVRMGMYAHSNQPSHHIPWLYLYAGRPDQTQRITREILSRLYLGSEIGQGYPGDEDNGEMSAWYLFSMLGLYPLRMGAPEYVIGSPLFERVDLQLDNGRTLTVLAHDNAPANVYVQSLRVNGKPWTRTWLDHADIAQGGTLEFTMGPEPSGWGRDPSDAPPSLTPAGQRPVRIEDHASQATPGPADTALVDDDAGTAARVSPGGEGLVFRLAQPVQLDVYTLTSGASPWQEAGWVLEGRNPGDAGWATLDERRGERFAWARQLRPFRPGQAAVAYQEYRLRLHGDQPLELAEVELLRLVREED